MVNRRSLRVGNCFRPVGHLVAQVASVPIRSEHLPAGYWRPERGPLHSPTPVGGFNHPIPVPNRLALNRAGHILMEGNKPRRANPASPRRKPTCCAHVVNAAGRANPYFQLLRPGRLNHQPAIPAVLRPCTNRLHQFAMGADPLSHSSAVRTPLRQRTTDRLTGPLDPAVPASA